LTDADSFVFDKFREKIKYFHPAFHSTTPEGLNSRLTFLHQCTRQGPTLEAQGANNLAFGRAPVCILRIGDFYNTKIIIDNISIEYDPLVWDLNSEGIGVQPMIANVSMSFKFIGASSLVGPINKLQNALSFNYYANTQVYDPRADYIAKVPAEVKQGVEAMTGVDTLPNFMLVNGAKDVNKLIERTDTPVDSANNTPVEDQVAAAEQVDSSSKPAPVAAPSTPTNDFEKVEFTSASVTNNNLHLLIKTKDTTNKDLNYRVIIQNTNLNVMKEVGVGVLAAGASQVFDPEYTNAFNGMVEGDYFIFLKFDNSNKLTQRVSFKAE
jgi:hypothetical protein